jgi:hypothetical protein
VVAAAARLWRRQSGNGGGSATEAVAVCRSVAVEAAAPQGWYQCGRSAKAASGVATCLQHGVSSGSMVAALAGWWRQHGSGAETVGSRQ